MRRIVGLALMVVAVIAVVLGVATAIVLGPDCRAVTGPHRIKTSGIAVVTDPAVLSWAGPKVTVLVEVPDKKPVFVGLGNTVDVDDYLAKTSRLTVSSYQVPWKLRTKQVSGAGGLPASPTALDWWLTDAAGLGGASITFRLPDESVALAILSVGDSNLEGLRVTTSYDVRGGFGIGLGVAVLGLGVGLIGWTMFRRRPLLRHDEDAWDEGDWVEDDPLGDDEWDDPAETSDPAEPDEVDEGAESVDDVVYIYVDGDGVEHEISPEDAHEFEIVDEEPRPKKWWRRR